MNELPKPNEGEEISDYIKRLLGENLISQTQIPLAVKKYNEE